MKRLLFNILNWIGWVRFRLWKVGASYHPQIRRGYWSKWESLSIEWEPRILDEWDETWLAPKYQAVEAIANYIRSQREGAPRKGYKIYSADQILNISEDERLGY